LSSAACEGSRPQHAGWIEGLGVTGDREDQAAGAGLLRSRATNEAMRSRTWRRMNKLEQLAIPFDVDTRVKVIRGSRWDFDRCSYRCRIEIVQAVWPTCRPGIHQGSQHLKIYVPALGVQLSRLVSQPKQL